MLRPRPTRPAAIVSILPALLVALAGQPAALAQPKPSDPPPAPPTPPPRSPSKRSLSTAPASATSSAAA